MEYNFKTEQRFLDTCSYPEFQDTTGLSLIVFLREWGHSQILQHPLADVGQGYVIGIQN